MDNDDNDDSDEEVQLPVQKQPIATPKKSQRLASKRQSLVVDLDDDSTSHNTFEPTNDTPPSLKPATPLSYQIPSPPPSPIPFTPPPVCFYYVFLKIIFIYRSFTKNFVHCTRLY